MTYSRWSLAEIRLVPPALRSKMWTLGLKYADRGCQFGGRKLCIYTSIPRARQKGEDKRLPGGIKRAAAGSSVDNVHLRGSVPSAQEKRRGVSLAEQLKVAIKEKGNIENGW